MAAWLALLTARGYLVSDLVTAWSLPKSALAPQTAYDDNPFHTRKGEMLGMAYYIYENWRAWRHKAIIHRGSCGHCNNGQGRNEGNYDPNNGAWHGPYADLQEAQEAQEEMPVEVHDKCRVCRP